MRSAWRQWPDEMRYSWTTTDGSTAYVVFPLLSEGRVEHDNGTRSPKQFTYLEFPKDPDAPYYVVECDHPGPDFRPRIISVQVVARENGPEVRSSDLRALHLNDAIEEALMRASTRLRTVREDATLAPSDLENLPPNDTAAHRTIKGLRKRVRRSITPGHLAEVARVYRENRPTGAPTKAVREHFHVSAATASNWVKSARDAQYDMGDAPERKKGDNK